MTNVVELQPGLRVIVRGWLHGNVVILPGEHPVLFDTGYCTGAVETIELVESTTRLPVDALSAIYLTHVHSDHAGGCAALRSRAPSCRVYAHPCCRDLVARWDERRLWLEWSGQELPRFEVDRPLEPGVVFHAGGHRWTAIDLPGHATGGLGFFDDRSGLLVGGDALWHDGLGALLPQIDGDQVFDEALEALDRIAGLPVKVVVPGHGEPFADVRAALERARRRVIRFRDDPDMHVHSLVRGLVAFWVLGHEGAATAVLERIVTRLLGRLTGPGPAADRRWLDAMWGHLETDGVIRFEAGVVYPGARILETSLGAVPNDEGKPSAPPKTMDRGTGNGE